MGAPTDPATEEPALVRGVGFSGGVACPVGRDDRNFGAFFLNRTQNMVIRLSVPRSALAEGWQEVPIQILGELVLLDVASLDIGELHYCKEDGAEPEVLEEWVAISGTVRVWLGPPTKAGLRQMRVRLERVQFSAAEEEKSRVLDYAAMVGLVEA